MDNIRNRSVDLWFPTAIYKEVCSDLTEYNNHLENKALHFFDQFNSNSNSEWRCDTFNTMKVYDFKTEPDQILQILVDYAFLAVKDFAGKFGLQAHKKLEMKDLWFNVSPPESYQEYHQHALSHFSVVYYVKVPKNSGNIVFQSFEKIFDMHTLPLDIENMTDFSFKSCAYEPTNSMMLIFRSNIMHMVEKNKSKENRISIAMNFNYKGS